VTKQERIAQAYELIKDVEMDDIPDFCGDKPRDVFAWGEIYNEEETTLASVKKGLEDLRKADNLCDD
jgi:hypothetical protein